MIVIGVVPLLALLACIPAYVAQTKGRSFGFWWVGGFLLWPLAMVEALTLRPADAAKPQRPPLVQTWRPFIALCSLLVMLAGALLVYLAAR